MKAYKFPLFPNLLFWLMAAWLILLPGPPALAQEDAWAEPVNLSQSGSAVDPLLAVDSEGATHVLWQDRFEGFVYTARRGAEWREPQPVALPFDDEDDRPPTLLADAAGRIHAFWQDDDYVLRHSWVEAAAFDNLDAWSPAQIVAESAIGMAATVGPDNRLHLAYIRQASSEQFPAGVYYRRTGANNLDWSESLLLQQSAYFRSINSDQAHVQVEASSAGYVFVVWDLRPLDTIYLARSTNGGQSWEESLQIDQRGPLDAVDAVGPSRILVAARGFDLHLLWQAGHGRLNCAIYHQQSLDGGVSWEAPQRLFDDCFQTSQFFAFSQDKLILMFNQEDGVYLMAAEGRQWSEPQRQPPASLFVHPQTFRTVNLGCWQAAAQAETALLVGCALGNNPDVWFLERSLNDISDWFTGQSVWESPELIAGQLLPAGRELAIGRSIIPQVVIENQDQIHLFWHRPGEQAIYYSRWDGARWMLQPAMILESPGGGEVDLAVIGDSTGRLLAMWSDSLSGKIYFSQVSADQAALASAWLDVRQLPIPHSIARWPALSSLPDGRMIVVYTVPINEDRGVYLTYSADRGQTWSEPAQLFDGVAAAWPMVGRSGLAHTASGELHLTWLRSMLDGAREADLLLYAHSLDGGESWSDPRIVSEAVVLNSQLVAGSQGDVHHIWQEQNGQNVALRHQYSADRGLSWSRATTIGGTAGSGLPTITQDLAGNAHLLRIVELTLEHWLWDGGQWIRNSELDFRHEVNVIVTGLSAAVSTEQGLLAFYAGYEEIEVEGQPRRQSALYTTSRELPEIAESEAAPAPIATPVSGAPAEPTPPPTLTPPPTVTAAPAIDWNREAAGAIDNGTLGLAIGILSAAFIVSAVFFLGFRAIRSGSGDS